MGMFRLCLCFFLSFTHLVYSAGCYLDLESAWQRLLQYSPQIGIADQEIYALNGEKRQVSLLPNPIATIEGNNLGVHHVRHDDDDDEVEPPETIFALTQLLELGGKRLARRNFAASLETIALLEAQIVRRDLRLALVTAFIDVSAAQEKLRLTTEREQVASEILCAYRAQIEGGKFSPIQERKAHVALVEARICTTEISTALDQAKKRLTSLWGGTCFDFDGVDFPLLDCMPPPSCVGAIEGFSLTPDYAKAQACILSAQENLKLQKSNSVPDVALTAGYKVFHDSGHHGWIVGAEFPLPFFDRNQGNIQKACAELSQAEYQMQGVVRDLKEQILITYEKWKAAFEESELIQKGALTEAQEIFELVQTGYHNGKLDYLELLEAHNLLISIQEKYVDTLHDCHLSQAEFKRLTGEIL